MMPLPDVKPELTGIDLMGLAPEAWLSRLEELGDEHGHFEPTGKRHANLFIDAGRTLLVTFETMESARALPGARPRGFGFAARLGWSALCFLSEGETWFRDPAVWGTFDRLTDDGFFEDFDSVLFFGAGSGGYAATALSVAAPGARVLAIRPQATLTPALAGWDRRFQGIRGMDFTSRYGFAPDMIDAAQQVDIVFDPMVGQDAIHAAMFARDNVRLHRGTWAGPRAETTFDRIGITDAMIETAMAGDLTRSAFGRLWRARRDNPAYLRGLLKRLETGKRPGLLHHLCNHGIRSRDATLFEAKLRELGDVVAAENGNT